MIHALYHNPDGATPEYISEGIQFQGEFLYSGDILFFFVNSKQWITLFRDHFLLSQKE